MLYGCALSRELIDFCFLSDFRIKQVLNLQPPLLFVTTDRCYGKCSGVGRVQQVAKGGVYGLITFIEQIGHINRVWLPILHEVSLTGKIASGLETENHNTLHILAALGPFAVNTLSYRLP